MSLPRVTAATRLPLSVAISWASFDMAPKRASAPGSSASSRAAKSP